MIGFDLWSMMMACAVVVLFTIHLVLRELYQRPTPNIPRRWCWVLTLIRWLIIVFMAVITAGLLGFSLGYALVAIGFAVLIQSIWMRRSEETDLLNSLAFSIVNTGASVPDAFEQFAGKRVSSIARRCRDFAYELRAGMRPGMAAKKRRLPLSVDALLALEDGQRSPSSSSQVTAIENPSIGSSLGWPLANQFAYFATSIFLVAATSFIGLFILPTFDQMWQEFGMAPNFALKFLVDHTYDLSIIAWLFVGLLTVFAGLIAISFFWPSRWLLRVLPWYGGWIRYRGQYHGLRALAAGLRSGRSMVDSAKQTEQLTRSRWIKSRAKATCRRLEAGQSTPAALLKSGFITDSESRWVAAADATGRLANSLESIAENTRRRFELLWRIRLSWMIPLTALLIGGCVAFLYYAVMGSVIDIIGYLS